MTIAGEIPLSQNETAGKRVRRLVVGLALVSLLCWAGVGASRAGRARLNAEHSSMSESLASSERALQLSHGDPEAHYRRAIQLLDLNQTGEAVRELEQAAILRPDDYFFWAELGRARDEAGDSDGAIIALKTAIKLAPFYSMPHWQLGNILLRADEPIAAFQEMRLAATSDSELFPSMLDLASGVFGDDTANIILAVQPGSDSERVIVVRHLLHGNRVAALELLRDIKANGMVDEDRSALVADLIASEEFAVAYRFRAGGDESHARDGSNIIDGGFESAIAQTNTGFGWQPSNHIPNVKMLLDANTPAAGQRSFRLDFSGNLDAKIPVLTQLVPVTPQSSYRFEFSVRSEKLLSAGLPIITLRQAVADRRIIAESEPLAAGTNGWQKISIDFKTDVDTRAIVINFERPCKVNPCPLVGTVWLDSFQLMKQ